MRVYEQRPIDALTTYVRRFLVVESDHVHRDQHLPDTGTVAAFSFDGSCVTGEGRPVPPAAFTGLWQTVRSHEHSKGHKVVLASFTPVGASAFLRCPLEPLTANTQDLSAIFSRGKELSEVTERIAEASTAQARVAALQAFLLPRVQNFALDPLVTAAIDWLEQRSSAGRIDLLCGYIGLSQSALERRFRKVVGLTPKQFSSLLRFRRAIALRAGKTDWTSVAHAAGYFDQAHFINDFRERTGVSPAAYRE